MLSKFFIEKLKELPFRRLDDTFILVVSLTLKVHSLEISMLNLKLLFKFGFFNV